MEVSQESPTLVVPELSPFHEWEECPRRTEMKQGWGSAGQAELSVAESPKVRRTNHLLQVILLSIGGKMEGATRGRWKFLDGEQKSLCTVALSPRELQRKGERGTRWVRKVWCGKEATMHP